MTGGQKALIGLGWMALYYLLGLPFFALGALFVQWAWNGVMPYAFGLPPFDYWHAFSLVWLVNMTIRRPHLTVDTKDWKWRT